MPATNPRIYANIMLNRLIETRQNIDDVSRRTSNTVLLAELANARIHIIAAIAQAEGKK